MTSSLRLPLVAALVVLTQTLVVAADAVEIPALQARAQAGDARAEVDLSYAYFSGKGVPHDDAKGYDWSLESAIQGNAVAERNIAVSYAQGHGVHANKAKAFEWFMKSARDGDAQAELAVGTYLQFGVGRPVDLVSAQPWLRKAAIQGNNEAQGRLGYNLLYGVGGEKNPEQGFAYLFESSKAEPVSRLNIAKCYADGLYVPRDPVTAFGWSMIVPPTVKEAQDFSATLKKGLTDDQIKQAIATSAHIQKIFDSADFQSPDLKATLTPGPTTVINYLKVFGYMVVPLSVQGSEPVNFLIDTGCSTSLLDSRLAAKLNVTGQDQLSMSGIGKDVGMATIADNVSISGSGLAISGARLVILPHFDFDEYLGLPIAGIIGTDILKNYVMRIDYAKKTLTFALPGQLPEDPKATSLPLEVKSNVPFIKASVGSDAAHSFTGFFLLDTGSDEYFSVTRTFLENHPGLSIRSAVETGATGFGGIELSSAGRTNLFIAGCQFQNPVVNMARDRQGNWVDLDGGIIGEGIFHRLDLTIDFPAGKLYFAPNAKFDKPFDFTFAGAGVKTTGGDYRTFVVYYIIPDSPAARVGLQPGDQLMQIDQRATNTMTMEEFSKVFSDVGYHELQVSRKGADLTIHLPVYDPFLHPELTALYRDKSADPPPGTATIETVAVEYVNRTPPIYPDDVIVRASGLQLGGAYLPQTGNRALKKLYATGLFANLALRSQDVAGRLKITITLQPNPVVKSIAFTGLTPEEETQLRPQLATEEGRCSSGVDVFQDTGLIQQQLVRTSHADRQITMDITLDDGSKNHQDIAVTKLGP